MLWILLEKILRLLFLNKGMIDGMFIIHDGLSDKIIQMDEDTNQLLTILWVYLSTSSKNW